MITATFSASLSFSSRNCGGCYWTRRIFFQSCWHVSNDVFLLMVVMMRMRIMVNHSVRITCLHAVKLCVASKEPAFWWVKKGFRLGCTTINKYKTQSSTVTRYCSSESCSRRKKSGREELDNEVRLRCWWLLAKCENWNWSQKFDIFFD